MKNGLGKRLSGVINILIDEKVESFSTPFGWDGGAGGLLHNGSFAGGIGGFFA
jgi:hypothetical protein